MLTYPSVPFLMSRINQKVSSSPSGYKLQDAQAILSEVRSIRDAISCGEKEKQELMQVGPGAVVLLCPRTSSSSPLF